MLLVAANMIGTGVFITTGGMLQDIGSGPAVLLAWFVGGVAALCGALSYAELGAALPHNGGEYHFLSRAFHPVVGFLAGWVSLVVGFAAPLALSSLAFGAYLKAVFPNVPVMSSSVALLLTCTMLHLLIPQGGRHVQNLFTAIKIGLIVLFIAAGVWVCHPEYVSQPTAAAVGAGLPWTAKPLLKAVLSQGFAVSLIFVSYAYAGWNSAAYVAGEFRQPARQIPWAMLYGTGLVALLYVGLNFVFLASAPAPVLLHDLAQKSADVDTLGHFAALHLFGRQAGRLVSLTIVLGMVSSVGALIITGPHVTAAMGARHLGLRWLALKWHGTPTVATLLQTALALTLMATASAFTLLVYVGLTLSLCSTLTVLALFVLRWREPNLPRPYRTLGYPLTPLLFLALQAWMIWFTALGDPESRRYGFSTSFWWSLGTLATGGVVYLLLHAVDWGMCQHGERLKDVRPVGTENE